MNPKSGKAANADAPEAPAESEEAVVADPGEQGKIEAAKKEKDQAKSESSKEEQSKKKSSEEEEEEEPHWIGILLKDEDGNPMPLEKYQVKLPDGKVVTGRLDKDGKARIDGIPKGGQCEVTFPRIHEKEVSQK